MNREKRKEKMEMEGKVMLWTKPNLFSAVSLPSLTRLVNESSQAMRTRSTVAGLSSRKRDDAAIPLSSLNGKKIDEVCCMRETEKQREIEIERETERKRENLKVEKCMTKQREAEPGGRIQEKWTPRVF